MSRAKRNALILLSAAGALILILAMSVPNIVLFSGEPFSLGDPNAGGSTVSGLASDGGGLFQILLQGVLALFLIVMVIFIIYSLFNREGRQRLAAYAVLLVLLFAVAQYLEDHPLNQNTPQATEAAALTGNQQENSGPPTAIFAATPPAWLTPVIILGAAALVVAAVMFAVWLSRRRRKIPENSLGKLAQAAQETIASIQAGSDFKVTVIRCYQDMMRVVKEEKGVARESAMTVREFEDQLVSKGLPQEAVQTLTRLFEQVRYGSKATSTDEEDLAVASLNAIVEACGGAGAA